MYIITIPVFMFMLWIYACPYILSKSFESSSICPCSISLKTKCVIVVSLVGIGLFTLGIKLLLMFSDSLSSGDNTYICLFYVLLCVIVIILSALYIYGALTVCFHFKFSYKTRKNEHFSLWFFIQQNVNYMAGFKIFQLFSLFFGAFACILIFYVPALILQFWIYKLTKDLERSFLISYPTQHAVWTSLNSTNAHIWNWGFDLLLSAHPWCRVWTCLKWHNMEAKYLALYPSILVTLH